MFGGRVSTFTIVTHAWLHKHPRDLSEFEKRLAEIDAIAKDPRAFARIAKELNTKTRAVVWKYISDQRLSLCVEYLVMKGMLEELPEEVEGVKGGILDHSDDEAEVEDVESD
jgi:hypothetical protein